jgi:hypothetical protein
MFAVYSRCQPIRLRLRFPPIYRNFGGGIDSMDSTLTPASILTEDSRAPEQLSLP